MSKQLRPRERIGEEWESYRRNILRKPGPVQVSETRRGFYAGAFACFNTVMGQLGKGEGDEPTEADQAVLDDLHAELKGFLAKIKAGQA